MLRTQTACCCALLLLTPLANAQPEQTTNEQLLNEIRELRARIEKLEADHAQQRQLDQERISELEKLVRQVDDDKLEAARTQAYAEQLDELQQQMPPNTVQSPSFGLAATAGDSTNLLNPAITIFIDTGGSISSRGENKALNRFNLREAELDFRAAIAPFADGVLIVALHEEIESARNGSVTISNHVEIEEGYVDFHTLPWDLALKFGKFRNAFGRANLLHTHDLPQVTRPLALTKFFGPEGMSTVGASLSWQVPNPWDKYLEVQVELVNADGGHEAPLLGGPNAENPAAIAHIKFFDDFGEDSTFELGGSYMFAHTSDTTRFTGHTFGVDATYQWIHPDRGLHRSFLVQTELFWSHNDIDRGVGSSYRNDAFGFYTLGQYQFHRDWYSGLRFDYTEFPNSASRGPGDWDIALAPYVSWYITEFLRLRGEYQHRMMKITGDTRSEEVVFLQLTFVVGSHPPHPYWVYR